MRNSCLFPRARIEIRLFFRLCEIPARGNSFFGVNPRRGTSLPGIVRRTAAAGRSRSRRGSKRATTERIFQLAAPAEMRRLCLSINMRRDKAARSFIRGGEWVSGSSGLGPARYTSYHLSRRFTHIFRSALDRRPTLRRYFHSTMRVNRSSSRR